MLPRSLLALLSALLLAATVGAQAPATRSSVDPSVGVPKVGNAAFFEKHEAFLQRAKAGPIGLLFLGDSITEGWKSVPELWEQHFGRYQPANFGIGGDQTQHVIWRLENGELEGIDPRVVVLMIGTNNSGAHTAPEIAAANRKIVQLIRSQLPQTKVLLLAIFPRGPRSNRDGSVDDGVARMSLIRDVNTELARLDDGKRVRFLDLGPRFLGADGKIPTEVMPDQLHLSPLGYQIWAESMQPLLHEMLR
jgi:lysophospholipase L1-like esterase